MIGKLLQYGLPLWALAVLGVGLFVLPRPAPATAPELAEVAVAYIKNDKAPLAQQALDQALALDASDFRANYVAGMLAFQQKDTLNAERHLKAALAAQPDNLDALLTLGAVYHRDDKYDQAAELYRGVLTRDAENAKANYNLGMLAIERHQLPEAKTYLQRYLALAPNAPDSGKVGRKIKAIEARLKAKEKKAS